MGALYRDLVRKHSKAKGSARALLNILADYATDEGKTWPSRSTLANDTGMSERNVTRCLQTLCDDGRLILEENTKGGRGRVPVYKILFPELEKGDNLSPERETICHPLDAERVTNARLKGDKLVIKGDKCVEIPSYARSEPQLEPKVEPKKDEDDKARARGEVIKAWEKNVGMVAEHIGEKLFELVEEVGSLSTIYGIHAAVENNVRTFRYVQTCARNHAAGKEPPVKPPPRSPTNGHYANGTSKIARSLSALDDYEAIKLSHGVTT